MTNFMVSKTMTFSEVVLGMMSSMEVLAMTTSREEMEMTV